MFHPSHSKIFQREIYRFGHFWPIFDGSVVNDQLVRLIENRTFSTYDYRTIILIIKSDKLFKIGFFIVTIYLHDLRIICLLFHHLAEASKSKENEIKSCFFYSQVNVTFEHCIFAESYKEGIGVVKRVELV